MNEGVVHRKPVANHKSRLQTHHFLGRGRSNVSHLPTPYACSSRFSFVWPKLCPSWVGCQTLLTKHGDMSEQDVLWGFEEIKFSSALPITNDGFGDGTRGLPWVSYAPLPH